MKPTAAPAYFPYRNHRNMKQVMRDEAYDRFMRLPMKERTGRTIADYM